MSLTEVYRFEPESSKDTDSYDQSRETSRIQQRACSNKRRVFPLSRIRRRIAQLPFLSRETSSLRNQTVAENTELNPDSLFKSWSCEELCKFALSNADISLRKEALKLLSGQPHPSTSATARRLLHGEKNLDLRLDALSLLSEDVSEMTLSTLLDVSIRDEHWLIRARTIKLLARYRDPRVTRIIADIARRDNKRYVRKEAISSLRKHKNSVSELALLRIVRRDSSTELQELAGTALKELAKTRRAH